VASLSYVTAITFNIITVGSSSCQHFLLLTIVSSL
jgi:hypothetical protein